MRRRGVGRSVIGGLVLTAACAQAAAAQPFEVVGTRALGMGGAFVAVADDATAVFWNPAGLATGALASLVAEGVTRDAGPEAADGRASRRSAALVALGVPALGLSYYRIRSTEAALAPPVAGSRTVRKEGETPPIALGDLVTHHAAVTLLQSVGGGVTVGTSLKLVHGTAAELVSAGDLESLLKVVRRHGGRADNTFDLDVGAMLDLREVRLGLSARNLRAPAFETASGGRVALSRQVRAGVAFVPDSSTTIALDLDLTETDSRVGGRRMVAAGAERWLARRRVGIRGGVRFDTVGASEPVASAGFSVGLTRSLWVDGFASRGGGAGALGWGMSVRVGS